VEETGLWPAGWAGLEGRLENDRGLKGRYGSVTVGGRETILGRGRHLEFLIQWRVAFLSEMREWTDDEKGGQWQVVYDGKELSGSGVELTLISSAGSRRLVMMKGGKADG